MDDVTICDPFELYNLLNQRRCMSRLAEINYLCLVDARERQDYSIGHLITARRAKMDCDGRFLLPEGVEVDSMQHVVVYDLDTSSLQEQGRAVDCAQVLAETSLHPVRIVKGGFKRFSVLYPFLTTEKILYTIMELENLLIYPVEIIAGQLFMGDQAQSEDAGILKDLKISAIVDISDVAEINSSDTIGHQRVLKVSVTDSVESDLYSSFPKICTFIDSHISVGSRVLVVSSKGRSRCSAATVAFIMHHLKYSLEEACRYMLRCKPTMRPNTGFLQQLCDWEVHATGVKSTDLSKLGL
ncbi:serine/threonine/tyrosine-interacting-like protein 1 [Cololabis saira]|uniref:serine/threonine/tyrosine-interacting-like protein 1 n=1 Tax=Cololabis saira TaxID=129043 RepID=UPI002AD52DDE|nr:serine/threonine/tyrosine-interacting-like protein 1 [Cololabis saira]